MITEEYATMRARIKKATGSRADLEKCGVSLDRLYSSGVFTAYEFKRLDNMILRHIINLEAA